jgi:CHASE2 domain-containing sensor protein
MNIVLKILEAAWAILCLIGIIAGIIAWQRRGFSIPRAIHIAAAALLAIGATAAVISRVMGIWSLGLTTLLCLGFPASAYVGWIVAGCPEPESRRRREYDIHEAFTGRNK